MYSWSAAGYDILKQSGRAAAEKVCEFCMEKRIVAFDIGDKRIGVAASDPFNTFALPGTTYRRSKDAEADAAALAAIALEKGAGLIVCGVPYNFDGSESVQTHKTRRFIELLRAKTDIPVIEEDERFTTMEAERVLIEGGVRREDRKRSIDSIAASYILEGYLNKRKKGEQAMSDETKLHEDGCDCEDCADEEVNVVELVDDAGKVHKCYHIGTIEYKEGWYAFFQPADEEEGEEDEVTILQIVGEEGAEELVPVEDDKLLDEVFEEFCRVMEEDDDADEAASLDTDYEEGCGCGCKGHDHKG